MEFNLRKDEDHVDRPNGGVWWDTENNKLVPKSDGDNVDRSMVVFDKMRTSEFKIYRFYCK
jgi:hypothetical protein